MASQALKNLVQQQEVDFSDVNDSFDNDNELHDDYDHGNEEEEADSDNENTSKDGNNAEERKNDNEELMARVVAIPTKHGRGRPKGSNRAKSTMAAKKRTPSYRKRIKLDNTMYILSPEEKEAD
ncbi:hypothetical protein HDU78_011688 [Chytriomyces hyalinus]|nr:hypothetical protein HDU78_011688 [Chytriomyces hyalinus]